MRRITKFPPALIAILALVFAVSTASVAKEKYSKFPKRQDQELRSNGRSFLSWRTSR